jgi:hypothetical protein
VVFNGVQITWTPKETKRITIIKDNRRHYKNSTHPYRLELDGKYQGDFSVLKSAMDEGVKLLGAS